MEDENDEWMKHMVEKVQKEHSGVAEQLKALNAEAMCCILCCVRLRKCLHVTACCGDSSPATMFLASQEEKFFSTHAPIKGQMCHVVGYSETPYGINECSLAAHSNCAN